ncbi:MAG: GIY-YIG nuclease family protein [Anaerolineae bacterium]|jgi:putative endonuclease|nr:GIY-YIG nuclease family protein [Anaerolineae bacterium]
MNREMMMKSYYVYILSSSTGTLYIGFTNDLIRRVYEHKEKLVEGFTKKYDVHRLIYYEEYGDVNEARDRERQLKGWRRSKKLNLIRKMNPKFVDLYDEIIG